MNPIEDNNIRLEAWSHWPKLRGLELLSCVEGDSFHVPPYVQFDVASWLTDPEKIVDRILNTNTLSDHVIVRSCAVLEDEDPEAPPGQFRSIANVQRTCRLEVTTAVESVILSYSDAISSTTNYSDHRVIVQKLVTNPEISGVALYSSVQDYYIDINFDQDTSRTSNVTNGLAHRRYRLRMDGPSLPRPWENMRQALKTLAGQFERAFFVEFAFDARGALHLFQIRKDRRKLIDQHSNASMKAIRNQIFEEMSDACDQYCPMSNMADWNPAEMLGKFPKPLDQSIYQGLLLDGAWQDGRRSLGWNKPSGNRLSILMAGRPYIDLRKSLESLLPEKLDRRLKLKLVRDRLRKIQNNPSHHDKIEFEIMWSSAAHTNEELAEELCTRGFTREEVNELHTALLNVTRRTFKDISQLKRQDEIQSKSLLEYVREFPTLSNSKMSPQSVLHQFNNLWDKTIAEGAVPFARQARFAFMIRYMLGYMTEKKVIGSSSLRDWFRSIDSVASRISIAFGDMAAGKISRERFNTEFGHLRPGTYSIEAIRYDQMREIKSKVHNSRSMRVKHAGGDVPKSEKVRKFLSQVLPEVSESQFWFFAADAMRLREELKFRYSNAVSCIIELLHFIAKSAELSKDQMSLLTVREVKLLLSENSNWRDFKARAIIRIEEANNIRSEQEQILLPDLIFSTGDLLVVEDLITQPTFVGSGKISAETVVLTSTNELDTPLAGKIVVLQSADPGYDWIFSQPIAGLITEYGGEFSHMALRCAELDVAAAIGIGDTLYQKVLISKVVDIDFGNSQIQFPGGSEQ